MDVILMVQMDIQTTIILWMIHTWCWQTLMDCIIKVQCLSWVDGPNRLLPCTVFSFRRIQMSPSLVEPPIAFWSIPSQDCFWITKILPASPVSSSLSALFPSNASRNDLNSSFTTKPTSSQSSLMSCHHTARNVQEQTRSASHLSHPTLKVSVPVYPPSSIVSNFFSNVCHPKIIVHF